MRALVHLPDGVEGATRLDSITVADERVTQFRGLVRPARVVSRAPAAERSGIAEALRNDYPATPFPANFWLDDAGRVRRVLVSYNTPAGSEISLDGRFSNFGARGGPDPAARALDPGHHALAFHRALLPGEARGEDDLVARRDELEVADRERRPSRAR